MKIKIFIALLFSTSVCYAQGPNGSGTYYSGADQEKGADLKTALWEIISSHKQLSYSQVWDAYYTTDVRSDGKVWDIYSNTTNYTLGANQDKGNHTREGDAYNREHTMPKSWFSDGYPMYTDIFHLMPSDGYVNGRRSNYPYGETTGDIYTSKGSFSKLGHCTTKGGSGIVFEPNDEYKGDLARNYFYMATAYEDKIADWSSSEGNGAEIFAGNSYPAYLDWQLDMLLRWAKNDPVSKKEIDRNLAVYKIQNNRNPYIDYPGLEQYVWGGNRDVAFNYAIDDYDKTRINWTDYEGISLDAPADSTTTDPTTSNDSTDVTPTNPVTPAAGENIYQKVTSSGDIVAGGRYLIVYNGDNDNYALGDYNKSIYTNVSVTVNDNQVVTAVGTGKPHEIELGGSTDNWTLYDNADGKYIAYTGSKNTISESATPGDEAKWKISIADGKATITNAAITERAIYYNASSPRFACYKATSQQQLPSLYKLMINTNIERPTVADTEGIWLNVCSIDGRIVKKHVRYENAFDNLQPGLYIVNHRKVMIK